MTGGDVLIYAVAVFFAGMGAAALVRPMVVLETFGTTSASAEARNEVRAVYGGFGLAVAGVLVAAVADGGATGRGIVVAVGVALAGMAGGRVVSSAIERPRGFYPVWFWFCAEVLMAAALLGTVWA